VIATSLIIPFAQLYDMHPHDPAEFHVLGILGGRRDIPIRFRAFEMFSSQGESHRTPEGSVQEMMYFVLRRSTPSPAAV
jgi:hypothetical protein